MKKNILFALLLSGFYISIGTYNYFNQGKVSHFFNDLKPGLDYTIVRPAEIFGVMSRFVGSFIYDSDFFFILGQLFGLLIYAGLIWVLITSLKLLIRKIKVN
ncbi:hypothetical protein [uncultured Aquimarina sp.]|uniref:hypothetical protein n=1 Tax=uncultured Aquimarina sp. TaxID=575652 RepID=UPI00262AD73E|nr:hypothetical protein [uncultured Aquimarina sp.]